MELTKKEMDYVPSVLMSTTFILTKDPFEDGLKDSQTTSTPHVLTLIVTYSDIRDHYFYRVIMT